ncbi:ABC transporter ATP-binding protein [Fibrobacter sp. UWB11]|uniref:ABC transporter ATP-binding protein n=1 Tax=Fibrobacter sp. UWB11 TaxID=1896202 RepID=UPI000926D80E|nr:ABC transporter ATP-binding protein [Fibrobacter sp. UWB11]SIO11786.1 ABC-2 type transport system ATP-binding protein [Fibrobacter sp. UWB11]
MIELSSVTFRYPKSTSDALSNISLCIPQGSFFALIGPNGAGKTTLLRLLCGRLGSFQGSIKIEDALCNSEGFLNAEKYGVLLENPGVYPKLSIKEYLQYFTGFYGFGEDSWRENGDMLNRCKLLADRLNLPALDKRLETLSLGNRQKVQIVRALLHNPKLLILDEPVANLDPISRDSVWHLLDEWRQETHGTAIVCSHVLAEMDEWATDYAIIDCGRVLKSGRVADIGADVASFKINAAGVSLEQIRAALAAAGISADVNSVQTSLSKIYRDLIH